MTWESVVVTTVGVIVFTAGAITLGGVAGWVVTGLVHRWIDPEPLRARVAKLKALPASETCRKCGALDIHTAWHQSEYDCSYSEKSRRDWPGEGGEHLHKNCRGCGFTWATGCLPPSDKEVRTGTPHGGTLRSHGNSA